MAKQKFQDIKLGAVKLRIVGLVNGILSEYEKQGFRLSLRQVYYQLVARGHVENNFRSYKNVGNAVNDGRMAGLIDWAMIEDRGRELTIPAHWDNPADIIAAVARSYRIDKWIDQPCHVEVMVEKDALSGVLEPVCRSLDIGLTANKGYSSASAMYEAGQRMQAASDAGKEIYVMYLGDHDPSGLDMTRDVAERLELFSGVTLEVQRLALNMDQVEQYRPPKNPAKMTDSRARGYVLEYGNSSWELDALEPKVLADLVRGQVWTLMDDDLWAKAVKLESEQRESLKIVSAKWQDVTEFLSQE